MYAQYLANQQTAINSIKNYVAGAKSWVLSHFGDIYPFMSNDLAMMYKSIAKSSSHVTKRASPLSWSDIYCISLYLDSSPHIPLAIKACILIGYSTFLRASNLLCTNREPWGGPHTLLACNIVQTSTGLLVVINSTKTKIKPYAIKISKLDDPSCCPVRAWHLYYTSVLPPSHGPAFLLPDKTPLSTKTVVAFMKAALGKDKNRDLSNITLHSLRRGAAQDAERSGVDVKQIMKRGGWSSQSGIKPYLIE